MRVTDSAYNRKSEVDFKITCNPIILCCTFKNTEHLKCRILMKHYDLPLFKPLAFNENKNGLFWFHGDFKRKMKHDTRLCTCTLIKIHRVFLLSLNNKLIIHSNELVKIRAPAITPRLVSAHLDIEIDFIFLLLQMTRVSFVHADDQIQPSLSELTGK